MTKEETWARLIELGAARGPMPDSENWYLHKVDLRGADLLEADLSGADLSEADLMRVNLSGANLIGINLFGADLSGADLIGANLSGADLIEATLIEADLSGANLIGADLSEADLLGANLVAARLSLADLSGTVLRGANLAASTLVRTNLSNADLSGVCIDNANLSGWNITGAVCTHLLQKKDGSRNTISFGPQEFEKRYAQSERIAELILNMPLAALTGFIGCFIAKSVNHVKGRTVMALKGLEALPDGSTRFTFAIFDDDFYGNQKDTLETVVENSLNDYFKRNPTEDMTEGIAGTGKNIILFPGIEPDMPCAETAVSYYIKIGSIEKNIFEIVASQIDQSRRTW